MHNKTVVIIVAIALCLFAVIYFVEKDSITSSILDARKNRVFVKYNIDFVEELKIAPSDGQEIVLVRNEDESSGDYQWTITSPIEYKADDSVVRSMLSSIDFILVDRTIEKDSNIEKEQFGIDKPRLQVSFKSKGSTVKFKIGSSDTTGEKVYVALNGIEDNFYAVEKEFFSSLNKDLNELRDKHLVNKSLSEAISVKVKNPSETIKMRRELEKPWKIERENNHLLAREGEVSTILRELGNIKASVFVQDNAKAENLVKYGLSNSSYSVDVLEGKTKTTKLLLGSNCKEEANSVYATLVGSNMVTCVSNDVINLLKKPATKYVEMRLGAFYVDDVNKLKINRDDNEIELEKDVDDIWKLLSDASLKLVDQNTVIKLLNHLSKTQASSVEIGQNFLEELSKPFAKLIVERDSGQSSLELSIYKTKKEEKETYKFRRKDELALFEINKEIVSLISSNPLNYRSRTIENGKFEDVENLKITGPINQTLKKADGTWNLTTPISVLADGTTARRLSQLMSELQVVQFVAEKSRPEFGLDNPFATIEATIAVHTKDTESTDQTNQKILVLKIGSLSSDKGRYAKFGNDNAIFVLANDSIKTLSNPIVARDMLQVEATKITKIELIKDGENLVVSQKNGSWSSESKKYSNETIKKLLANVEGAKVIRADSFDVKYGFEKPTLTIKLWTNISKPSDAPVVLTFGKKSEIEKEDGYFAKKDGLKINFIYPGRIVEEFISLY